MYDRLQLTNMLRSEVERIPETGLPLEVFPARIQELVLNLARYENFNVEYTASILLSAVATAIGNSCRIRIKGEWKTSPSIYMMLVGRPGLGKTPPLGFLYKPIREHDDRMYETYNKEWNTYEKALASSGNRRGGAAEECTLLRKPQLVTTVISDFTPEAMMSIHQHNPRGIALVVDEIRALFNSVKRYNNRNNLIEDLLTAYSGQPLKVIRKSEAQPILIKKSVHQHYRFGADQSAAGDLPGRIHGKRTAGPLFVRLSERPEDFGLEARRRYHCPAGSGRTVAGGAGQDSEPPLSGGCCAEYGRRRGGVFLQLVQRHH